MQDVVDNLQYDVTSHVHKTSKKIKSCVPQYRNDHFSTSVGNDHLSDTVANSFIAEASLQVIAYIMIKFIRVILLGYVQFPTPWTHRVVLI